MFEKTKSLYLVSLFKSLLDSVISVYLYVLGIVVFIFAFGIQFDYKMLIFGYTFFILALILSRIVSVLTIMYKHGKYNNLYSLLKSIFSFILVMKTYTMLSDSVNPFHFVKNESVYLTTSYFLIVMVILIVGSKILSKLIRSMFEKLYYDHPDDFHLRSITYVYSDISGMLLHELHLYELKGFNFFDNVHMEIKGGLKAVQSENNVIDEKSESETIIITKDFEEEKG